MGTSSYRAVDHVMVRALNIDRLLWLFSNVFELPISWPKESNSFATFAWVHVGNTDLELWASTNNKDLPVDCQPPLIHGFALDPMHDLGDSIAKLAKVGIQCKEPKPYRTPSGAGTVVTNFTNSVVLDLSSESCCVFFCAWDPDGTIFPWTERLTSQQRSARDRREFLKRGGGVLGLVGLAEIELSTPELSHAMAKWAALSGEGPPFSLTSDIQLKLLSGPQHVIQSLTFEVTSLESVRAFLSSKGLLGTSRQNELTLDPHATDGLKLKFREATSAVK